MSEGGTKRRRRWRWGWWLLFLILLAGGGYALARRRASGAREVDQSLTVKVKRGDLVIEVIETAKVQPREKVEIKSKVAGQVEKVFVVEGQKVKKGQILLRLDATDYRRDLARSEAEVAQAENALEFAQVQLDRKKRAFVARASSDAEVDTAQNEFKVRTVALRTARVTLDVALDRVRYTEIVSPLTGTVIQRGIEPGEVVTPGVQATFEGKALLTVADLSHLIVRAELNQIDVAKVRLGQDVTLTMDALPGRQYHATMTKIAPASSLPKGKDVEVFPVEATLVESDDAIKPGMTADVRIHIETHPKVLILPIEAVVKEKEKYYATRVKTGPDGQPLTDKIEIKTGARNDRETEVLGGLGEGDTVLIRPASAAANEAKTS